MCRTVHALLQTLICGIQMMVRVFMTIILMIENLIRMILQTLYNFISFLLQMLSLIPICIVFLLTARLKCFMCGGGGPCPVNRGGACDCIMSALAIVILFFIFRATGVLDKIFYSIGYSKARIPVHKFVPTPGIITECSRNDTDYEEISSTLNETEEMMNFYTSTIDLIEYSSTTPFDTNNLDDIDKFGLTYYTTTTEAQTEPDISSTGNGTSTTPKPQNNSTNTTTTSRASTTTSLGTTTTKRTTTSTITTTTKSNK